MRWSWKVGTVAGIGIYIHWTFLLLVAWIVWGFSAAHQDNPIMLVESVAFLFALFGCVLLHELGHALTAKRFNIQTRDITLLPIGGLARLEKMPDDPTAELWVALAGPAVNVVIAVILFVLNEVVFGRMTNFARLGEQLSFEGGHFLLLLMMANVILAVFNLLPAFPMDGGRVFRAILAHRLDYAQATRVAASVGQMMAILFGVFGFFVGNFILMFIAVFVYLGAEAEAQSVEMRLAIKGVPVRAAMMTRFQALSSTDTLERGVDQLLAGAQQDFPVVDAGRLVGMLARNDLFRAVREGSQSTPVGEVMNADCPRIDDSAELERAVTQLRDGSCSTLAVVHGDRVVGIITLENIGEWLTIHSATHRPGADKAQ